MTHAFAESMLNSMHKLQLSELAPDGGPTSSLLGQTAVSTNGEINKKELCVATEMYLNYTED